MKKTFTKLFAALALLVFMTPSMVGWGQSNYSATQTSNCTLTAGTNGSSCTVNTNAGIKVGTSKAGGTMTVTVPSGAKYLHIHVAAWNGVSGLSVNITPNTNISPASISLTADSGIAGSSTDFTLNGTASSTDFYKVITFTNALTEETTFTFTTSTAKRFVIWGVNSEEDSGSGSQLTPSNLALTGAPVALSFDLYNNSSAQTVNFTTSSTGAVTVSGGTGYVTTSVSGNTITVTPVAVTPSAQTITISQDADATYAAGSVSFTVEVDDSTPSTGTTATFTYSDYTGQGTSSSGSEYTMVKPDVSIKDTKFYGNTSYAQFYAGGTTTIMPGTGVTITKIVLTASGESYNGYQNSGTVTPSTGSVSANGATVTWTGSASTNFTIEHSKQIRWTTIVVTYSISGSSLDPSDLAITGAPVALSFDLYNNSSAQTVSYTTSSTGAITIEPATPTSYFSYVHDATNKTITVTPLAVTPSAQTVTISQEADENYYAGTATFTVSVTNSDPDAPGTLNNPYTVAEARAAIDGNIGVTDVYVTGIVSNISEAYNAQYSNISFDIVDESGDTDFLRAYRCTGTDAANVEVGDIVVVSGDLTYFNAQSLYEFSSGCVLQSLTHPSVAVEAPTFSIAAGGYATTQSVTLACETSGTTIYYTTDGTTPSSSSTQYTGAISVSTTTTIKAIAIKGSDESTIATADYYIKSSSNTYTVTEALAFNSYPQNNIFVNGIVCTAPTDAPTSNGELTYYISVDGEATNKLEVYKGKNINNTAFANQIDIQVGDQVTIFGNVKIYNDAKEFEQGNYLVEFARPTTITASDVNIAYDDEDGEIAYTINNPVTGGSIVASTEDTWLEVDDNAQTTSSGTIEFICEANNTTTARTATVTLTYTYNTNETVTKTVTVTQAGQTNTYNGQGTFTKVTTLADLEDGGYYVLVNSGHALKASYYGSTTNEMASSEVTANSSNQINNPATDIVWKLEANSDNWNLYNENAEKYCYNTGTGSTGFSLGESAAASYSVSLSNDAYIFQSTSGSRCIAYYSTNTSFRTYASSNANAKLTLYKLGEAPTEPYITVAPDQVTVPSTGGSGSLAIDYDNMTIANAAAITIQYYDDNNQTISAPAWMSNVSVAAGATSGYVINYTIAQNDGTNRTATFKVYASDGTENVYSNLVTFTQSVYVAPVTYTLATSIENGRHYIIANGSDKAMGAQGSNNRSAVAVEIENDVATVTGTDVYEFVINGPDANGKYTIYDAERPGYLYNASTSNNSYLRTQTNNNTTGQWTITFDNDNKATITSYGNSNRPTIMYNSGSTLFSCYASGQSAIYLYMKDEVTPQYDFYMDIAAWTVDENNPNDETEKTDGWYFIASPINSDLTPSEVGMITPNEEEIRTYDLYRLSGNTWENYRQHPFNIANGVGYLYANKNDVTLHFSGTSIRSTENNTITLYQTGWNLISNPFNCLVTVNKDFGELNNGSAVANKTSGNLITPCAGIAVYGEKDEVVEFTIAETQQAAMPTPSQMNIVLAQQVVSRDGNTINTKAIDNAVVTFNGNAGLPKFTLFDNDSKLYIPQNGKDYAIVSSDGHGSMPLNFKAKELGRYTISVNTEGLDMSYLHLIDRLTGEDVNLLLDSEYSFIASNNDSEERFILSFTEKGYDAHDNEIFVYQSGNDLIVSGEGELQIFDVMGRMVKNTVINGVEAIAMPQGVYIFKLNGNVQKIVVR